MWVIFDEAKLKGGIGLTGPELNAARTAALPDGVSDKLTEILTTVIREVRGRVKACPRNSVVGEDGTIPDECLSAARARCVYELCLAIPGKVLLTEQRVEANKQAISFLKDIARCEVVIEPPETASDESAAAPKISVICAPPRQMSRGQLSGL